MTKPRIAMFDTKPYDQSYFSSANERYDFPITYFEPRLTENTVKLAEGFDVACLFVHDAVDEAIAEELKRAGVRLVALRSNGYNHVDVATLFRLGIPTVRVPKYSPYAIAEYTVGLILALNRKIHLACWRTKMNNFSLQGLIGCDMRGKTVGVIGAGQIGSVVIKILSAFGCSIIVYDPFLRGALRSELEEIYKARFVSDQEELFTVSDFITFHCQLTEENRHCVNRYTLAKMKRGVFLINTSRGGLIDTEALIESLKTGHVGACALDVYEEEEHFFFEDFSATFINDDVLARLLTFPNAIVTAHQAFFTKEAMQEIAATTLQNVRDFSEGRALINAVNEI